jgi:hypothetical protein
VPVKHPDTSFRVRRVEAGYSEGTRFAWCSPDEQLTGGYCDQSSTKSIIGGPKRAPGKRYSDEDTFGDGWSCATGEAIAFCLSETKH